VESRNRRCLVPERILDLGCGSAALEREACLNWLDRPDITRQAIEDLLLSSFDSALKATGRHDPATAQVLARLAGAPDELPA
jgi:hypothetical protein